MIRSTMACWAVLSRVLSRPIVTVGVSRPCSSSDSNVAGNVFSVDSSKDVTGSLTGPAPDAESQHRDVVVEAIAQAVEQGADGGDGSGRGGRRDAGRERPQGAVAVAVPSAPGAGLGQPVGVQQEGVAGAQPDRPGGEDRIVDDAEER